MAEKYEQDADFLEKIKAVISTPAFEKLKLTQHHQDSVYNHTLRVTYTAYKIGGKLKANESALLRGALFHDLYYHDWRDMPYLINHGWTHPVIALKNAKENFAPITDLEANIISSHMWPFNPLNVPRFKESLILSFSDKLVASGEVVVMFFNFLKRAFKNRA